MIHFIVVTNLWIECTIKIWYIEIHEINVLLITSHFFLVCPPVKNPADKASNSYTFVCRKYYVSILIEELVLNSLPGNPTYNLTYFSASEVLENHKSVLTSFDPNEDGLDLPYIYWIPKMHTNPYKHRFIAGSAKCSTKPLSILLTKLLTHWVVELNWLFNVTINDTSVIYVTAHRCAGVLKKKLDIRSGSQRHRHFVGFFNVPVQAPTRDQPFSMVIPPQLHCSRLLRHAGDTEDTFST